MARALWAVPLTTCDQIFLCHHLHPYLLHLTRPCRHETKNCYMIKWLRFIKWSAWHYKFHFTILLIDRTRVSGTNPLHHKFLVALIPDGYFFLYVPYSHFRISLLPSYDLVPATTFHGYRRTILSLQLPSTACSPPFA